MRTPPPDLTDARVADALRHGWGISISSISYAPVGFGSHHWEVTSQGTRWFATVDDLAHPRLEHTDDVTPRARLEAAFAAAVELREAGLSFVVAPLRTLDGDAIHPVEPDFAVSLFPFVEGRRHSYGHYEDADARDEVVRHLARLHTVDSKAATTLARRDAYDIPCRTLLLDALDDLDEVWGSGPLAPRAMAALGDGGELLRMSLDRHDAAVAAIADAHAIVTTHGEPHRGNTVDSARGIVLVDWDTLLLAPPERDLWSLVEEDPGVADLYRESSGITLEPALLDLYRRRWHLTDVAIGVAVLRTPHGDDDDAHTTAASIETACSLLAAEPPG